jgi:hypothetical protein
MAESKAEYMRAYYRRNRETLLLKQRARSKSSYQRNPEQFKTRARNWKAANPERTRELQQRHQERNRDKINQRSRDWYEANKARAAKQTRSRKLAGYGLTQAQFDAMLIAQNGNCAICMAPMDSPRVDHCHKTGAVRGLLCKGCNSGLGMFRDQPSALMRAADYLTRSSSGVISTTNSER